MPKARKSPKPKAKKPQRDDVDTAREATKREVGDMADKITRAPKKR